MRGYLFLAAIVLSAVGTYACTILAVQTPEGMIVGNNEDYFLDVESKMWVSPGEEGEHGRVCFGFDQKKLFPFAQGGVNDAGLFFDAAVTPAGPEPPKNEKPKAPRNMGDRMLAECATVEEAVAWLATYRLHLLKGSHLLLADASGAAAVVELVDGAMNVIRSDGPRMVVTNFSLSQPETGNHPCPRYTLASSILDEQSEYDVNSVGEVLQRTAARRTFSKNDNRDGGTLYSNIYNLNKLKIAVFLEADFVHPIIVEVRDYLARGEKTYSLAELAKQAGAN